MATDVGVGDAETPYLDVAPPTPAPLSPSRPANPTAPPPL
jgi:hypothetical protein